MPFAPLANDCFLRACRRQATDYTPVWLMRQAGRYLAEYRALRARAGSFLALAQNVDFATEVTLQPLERFALDAAIIFSDILTVPDAMGLGLSFAEGEGPRLARPLRDEADVARLEVPDMERLRYVFDAIGSARRALAGRVPLIGFAGSPWTLACYMVEGGASPRGSDWPQAKHMLYTRPELMERVLEVNAHSVARYLNAQIQAGAQAVMLFDSWGGTLADGAFQRLSLASMQRVLGQLERHGADGQEVPRIVFVKGGGVWLEALKTLDCEVLGLDWTMNLGRARAVLGDAKAIQGNLDPAVLLSSPQCIAQEARAALDAFGAPHTGRSRPGPTHIFNLGHGIQQQTPPEHVAALVDAVHEHSRALRRAAS